MADLPELSNSTKRKLALQWSTLLDTNRLAGEHLHWHERERDRLQRIAAQSPGPGPDWRNERAADETGIPASVKVVEARFANLSGEYWPQWLSSGDGYEAFVGWLEELKGRVSSEIASVWKGKSKPIDCWYERACGPAVEKALAALVKDGTNRARGAEMKRLETGAQPKGDSRKDTEPFPEAKQSGLTEPKGNEPTRTATEPDGNGADPRAAVDAFILKCKLEISLKVNRKHIWLAVGHTTARQFQFWQASDPKATMQDAQNFRRILAMNPTDFETLLKKKRII